MNDHERKRCKYIYGEILRDPPKFVLFLFLQISKNIDGFRQNNSQGFKNS